VRQPRLTRREEEVLAFVAQGQTSKQIADTLQVSVHTVNNHRKHSTAELVSFAAQHYLMQDPAEELERTA
jgi:two-component system nitrate/nitrite response regulator NarL